jgi:TRAP-type C4-dicarboxylate transport system permease large subunit
LQSFRYLTMKRFIPRLLVVYGASLSVLFGVALIPDYAALINAVEQRQEQAELRHRINVFAEGTWFLLANLIAVGGLIIGTRSPEH